MAECSLCSRGYALHGETKSTHIIGKDRAGFVWMENCMRGPIERELRAWEFKSGLPYLSKDASRVIDDAFVNMHDRGTEVVGWPELVSEAIEAAAELGL